MPRYPNEIVCEALKLYERGLSCQKIASRLGVSNATVWNWTSAAGIQRTMEEYMRSDQLLKHVKKIGRARKVDPNRPCFTCGKNVAAKRKRDCLSCLATVARELRKRYPEYARRGVVASRTWREHNKEHVSSYRKRYRQAIKETAHQILASANGDVIPRCRIDLTPGTSVSDLPCRGNLQIDHIFGGGTHEKKSQQRSSLKNLQWAVACGKRSPRGLRLLCQLHQLWNQITPIQEDCTSSESRPR